MGLDTFYRPKNYSEVLGQEATIEILREVVRRKQGFRQSYCFAGPYGMGKTTLARIFAKALMCDFPKEGEACGECASCRTIDSGRSHPDIIEIDAAEASRKEDMEKILEEIKHSSFSGKHKIYIMDEAHSLSKQSQDFLLLPLENTLPNSEDKRLVCIFCTTEPSKMRPAILSRCAPSFTIGLVSPDQIANRLSYVCEEQGYQYEKEALVILGEINESHIRDCLKAIEVLGPIGPITKESVQKFLQLDYNDRVLDVLLYLNGDSFDEIPGMVEDLILKVSSSFLYKKLAEYSMTAFRKGKLPSYMDEEKFQRLQEVGQTLLKWTRVFSSKPYNADKYALICDLHLCWEISHGFDPNHNFSMTLTQKPKHSGNIKAEVTGMGVYVNPSARKAGMQKIEPGTKKEEKISEEDFSSSLKNALAGLSEDG